MIWFPDIASKTSPLTWNKNKSQRFHWQFRLWRQWAHFNHARKKIKTTLICTKVFDDKASSNSNNLKISSVSTSWIVCFTKYYKCFFCKGTVWILQPQNRWWWLVWWNDFTEINYYSILLITIILFLFFTYIFLHLHEIKESKAVIQATFF